MSEREARGRAREDLELSPSCSSHRPSLSLFLSSPVIAKGNSAVRASANKDNGGIFRPVSLPLYPNADGFAMVCRSGAPWAWPAVVT